MGTKVGIKVAQSFTLRDRREITPRVFLREFRSPCLGFPRLGRSQNLYFNMAHRRLKSVARPLALLLSVLPYGNTSPAPPCSTPPGVHIPKQGAVASQSTVCSNIGIQLLKDGGNAVDALVGTVFCVGVIGMYHSGIGGGGFLLMRLSNGTYEFVDMRETAPGAATQDMYNKDENLSLYGGMAR